MRNFLKNIFLSSGKDSVQRTFEPKIFKSTAHQEKFEKDGYIHLKAAIDKQYTDALIKVYEEATEQFRFYENNPNFLNTMALNNSDAKYYLKEQTTPILSHALASIIDVEKIDMPFGGAYCINPPNAIMSCKPHQDPAYVDEEKTYSVIAWIPLEDINMGNGCLHVLPKSHLWGNSKRSINMDWVFEDYSAEFWKYLIPVPVEIGDIIVFDAALIHGTTINTTQTDRLALNVPILPKNAKMVTFSRINGYLVSNHEIDSKYYLDEHLFQKPSKNYISNISVFSVNSQIKKLRSELSKSAKHDKL